MPEPLTAEWRLCVVSCPLRDHHSRVPSGCSTAQRRPYRSERHTTGHQDPRDDRVGVPHLAGVEVVASPDRRGNGRQQIEDASSLVNVVREVHRTSDRLPYIGNRSISPAPDLVSEQTEVPERFESNGTFGYDPSSVAVAVRDRRLLDDVASLGDSDLQRRVVEVTPLPVLD